MAAAAEQKQINVEVKLIKNIKYGDIAYKMGDTIKVKEGDIEEFKKAGVIKVE
ncbi:hypothetical protein [Clostridium kluyveri]|uniref:DUF7210 family protein n=1 Tax=Clostridium kluyveri TaxID=1534 RepID=UPI0022452581|nr:hypothetical protein [Clostridium kluyveri]UZQ49854.1 hypothetical protein OP486_18190 [Clostridium kluyveri]